MILLSDFANNPTPSEAIILRELITFPEFVSSDRIFWALWADREDGGPLWAYDEIRVLISTLKPKLHPGVKIENRWGMGYRLKVSEAECLAA